MDSIPDEVRDELESYPNVIGTGRGQKRVNDRPTGREAVIAFVTRKYPETELADDDRVPRTVRVDDGDVPTDVQEVGEVRPQAMLQAPEEGRYDRKREWRPAPGGVSAGHPEISAGTLGTPPLRTEDGKTAVLTNRHVAAPVGKADRGDAFLQPGPADGGTMEDDIGELLEWSDIERNEPNRSDSALVTVDPEVVDDTELGIGKLVDWGEINRDATYTKSGRTTGVTTGDLRARDVRIKVNGYYSDTPSVFVGVDVFGPMSAGGDSGSVIGRERDDGFYGTHLLFAGSDRSTIGIPMDTVQQIHGNLVPLPGEEGGGGGSPVPDVGETPDAGREELLAGLSLLCLLVVALALYRGSDEDRAGSRDFEVTASKGIKVTTPDGWLPWE